MRYATHLLHAAFRFIMVGMLLGVTAITYAQVSPVEVLNPKLKSDEAQYFPQLRSLQQSIAVTRFPFPFRSARYPNGKHGQRAASDPNGIEFVYFEGREILKISGIYQAAFNAALLSKNERASQTFRDVVVPILGLVRQQIPTNVDCEGIGFEIIYNTRDANSAYDYEGREVLTVVFDRGDAFSYADATDAQRQQILNRSDIFVDGKEFGLAPGQPGPLNVQTLERSVPRQAREGSSSIGPTARPADLSPAPVPRAVRAVSVPGEKPVASSPPTSSDANRLQAQFQGQLNDMVQDWAKFHLVESAPPLFKPYGDRTVLHLTMRNTLSFDGHTSSIYKRAAQSFDLFLAPELKDLVNTLPDNAQYDALDVSVLNRIGAEKTPSETVDYICPLGAIRSFVQDKITSQGLIDQSIVLVNGVRIALNLQLVE